MEMSREGYARRRIRANRVSMLSGFFGVLAFILFLAVFLWNYWLNDIFSTAKRVDIPNFIGSNYDDIVNSKNFNEMFNFGITYEINPDIEKGVIIRQDPEPGKSYMLSDNGIDIDLVISTGVMLTEIPDYTNYEYREAISALEKAGFVVEKTFESSSNVTTDYIINISPSPGEKLPAGATVYITVSLGPEVETVIMPYLVGKMQNFAEEQINSLNLTLVTVSSVYSDAYEAGAVISQNVEAGTEIPVHSKIYLQVSLGPEPTPTPAPTQEPTPEPVEG
jgi:serine/threonine-protein kinase